MGYHKDKIKESSKTCGDVVGEYFPDASDDEDETGYPTFWSIPEDGNTPEECPRKQLMEYKDLYSLSKIELDTALKFLEVGFPMLMELKPVDYDNVHLARHLAMALKKAGYVVPQKKKIHYGWKKET